MGAAAVTLERVRAAPKVLLHDHLDGGLRTSTILELADASGWAPRLPTTDPIELGRWFVRGAATRDILQYLATFEHTVGVMQAEAALHRVAAECAEDLADDGVVYAEVRFAPELHTAGGLAMQAVLEAVQAGFRAGEARASARGRSIVVNTIVCAMRTEQRSVEVVQVALAGRERDDHVVAFDLAGAETGWPPSLHAEALALARHHQLHLTIHASEPPDLELIAGALEHGAERIGHGVRLGRDIDPATGRMGRLARSVLERQITLELAPTCNVQIGAVPTLAEHPIGPFLRAGFRVTANTDNRLMSGVTVSSEVFDVARTFDLTWAEVGRLALNALDGSFADHATKHHLRDTVIIPAYH